MQHLDKFINNIEELKNNIKIGKKYEKNITLKKIPFE
jgi:hypothetical protein